MRFWRAHGLGNDYLVMEAGEPLNAALVQRICDRHRGVGSDGILEPADRGPADYGVRIWNPDGSIAEKSGNGLRIFARWLADHGAGTQFSVWTGVDRVECTVGDEIAIAMGTAHFVPEEVPVSASAVGKPLDVGVPLDFIAVGLGNPHCVVFRDADDLETLPWRVWGAALERHPAFPNRTNVQFAQVAGPQTLRIRIWERGAGETMASGSSACAVASAAVKSGRLNPGEIAVDMPGGRLWVTVDAAYGLILRGPVGPVGTITLDPRF